MGFHKDLTGEDLHGPSNIGVENNSGGTITGLTVVKYDGIGTALPQVIPISSLNDDVAGIVCTDLPTGQIGAVTAMGFVFNVNTAAFLVGDLLYADATGKLTTTPSVIAIGTVVVSDASAGVILVKASRPPVVIDVPGYTSAQNPTLSTENAGVFKNHLNLSSTIVIPGAYRLKWYTEYANTVPGSPTEIQINLTINSLFISTISSLQKVNNPAAIALADHNGFSFTQFSEGDDIDLDLNFRAVLVGTTGAVINSRLEMERVGP